MPFEAQVLPAPARESRWLAPQGRAERAMPLHTLGELQ
jgi:hypothetical protein